MWQRLLSTLVFIELAVLAVHSEWMLDDSGLISWSRDCDFPGGDLFKTTSKDTECGKLCIYFSECSYFAWGNGNCYFKSWDHHSPTKFKWFPGVVCGFVNGRENGPIVTSGIPH